MNHSHERLAVITNYRETLSDAAVLELSGETLGKDGVRTESELTVQVCAISSGTQ